MKTFVKVKSGDKIKILNSNWNTGDIGAYIYKEVGVLVYKRRIQWIRVYSENWTLPVVVVPINVLDIL